MGKQEQDLIKTQINQVDMLKNALKHRILPNGDTLEHFFDAEMRNASSNGTIEIGVERIDEFIANVDALIKKPCRAELSRAASIEAALKELLNKRR